MATEKDILKGANSDQEPAIKNIEGPCFILAGPGSGKTFTVIRRTMYMIHKGVDASKIVLFTFTNKAAKEIKDRVISVIGEEGKKITVGTYHSICVRILKSYANFLGYTNQFSIFDTDDCKKVLKELVKGTNLDVYTMIKHISDYKNKMITPARAVEMANSDLDTLIADIYSRYQKELKKQNAMDFDDLIANTIKLFESNHDVLEKINKKYHYITADESHDSSSRDLRLIELLAGDRKNVCFILDNDQSIYAFRGADIEAVLKVREVYPDLKTFILKENYRSSQYIVKAARSLIAKNEEKIKKEIFTNNDEGVPPIYFEELNQKDEALRVMSLVLRLVKKYNLQYKDVAVLYRTSMQTRYVEEVFLQTQIPYTVVGGHPFYSRKEIKDILCYIRLIVNPNDFEAFKRVINTPKRNLGDKAIEKIFTYSRENDVSLVAACKKVEIKGKGGAGLDDFNRVVNNLVENYESDTPAEYIDRILRLTAYQNMLFTTESRTDAEERMGNIIEFATIASAFDNIEEFIQGIALNSEVNEDEEENDNKVQLMTMHSSKGLEYKAVIIIGCNEGTSPHWRAQTKDALEEERRLFYVAMTRAEEYLFFIRHKIAQIMGRPQGQVQSRFIKEIDKQYLVFNKK